MISIRFCSRIPANWEAQHENLFMQFDEWWGHIILWGLYSAFMVCWGKLISSVLALQSRLPLGWLSVLTVATLSLMEDAWSMSPNIDSFMPSEDLCPFCQIEGKGQGWVLLTSSYHRWVWVIKDLVCRLWRTNIILYPVYQIVLYLIEVFPLKVLNFLS